MIAFVCKQTIENKFNEAKIVSFSWEDCLADLVSQPNQLTQSLGRFSRRHTVRHCCSNWLFGCPKISCLRKTPFV
jgi:hypothetical protein